MMWRPRPSPARFISDKVSNLLDGLDLLFKIGSLKVVSHLSISMTVGHLVHVEEGLVDSLLKLKASLNGFQCCSPFITGWFSDFTENNSSSSHVLVVNKTLSMLLFFLAGIAEPLGESHEGDVITSKVRKGAC